MRDPVNFPLLLHPYTPHIDLQILWVISIFSIIPILPIIPVLQMIFALFMLILILKSPSINLSIALRIFCRSWYFSNYCYIAYIIVYKHVYSLSMVFHTTWTFWSYQLLSGHMNKINKETKYSPVSHLFCVCIILLKDIYLHIFIFYVIWFLFCANTE